MKFEKRIIDASDCYVDDCYNQHFASSIFFFLQITIDDLRASQEVNQNNIYANIILVYIVKINEYKGKKDLNLEHSIR